MPVDFSYLRQKFCKNIARFTLKFSDDRLYRQLTLKRGKDHPCDSFLFDCNSTSTQYYVAPKMNENFKVIGVFDEIAKVYLGRLCNTHYEGSRIRNLRASL